MLTREKHILQRCIEETVYKAQIDDNPDCLSLTIFQKQSQFEIISLLYKAFNKINSGDWTQVQTKEFGQLYRSISQTLAKSHEGKVTLYWPTIEYVK